MISDASERTAELSVVLMEEFGFVPGSLWSVGFMVGAQIATTHPEVAKQLLDDWFSTPHSEGQSKSFYMWVDFIADGKEPSE